jgi:UTP--glucose-1-phosphate uridylyltransferase
MIKKAIIPIAGFGTRFLPLSKVLPKELFPLASKPILQYVAEEAAMSGIKEIIFVTKPGYCPSFEYFKRSKWLEEFLRKKGKKEILKEMESFDEFFGRISFSRAFQKKALGDGHAVLSAKKFVKNGPFAVLFCDDVVESKKPCLSELEKVFNKYKRPVVALYTVPKEKSSSYGMVKVEKIGKMLYEIKGIKEKPSLKDSPSNLAIVGKYILTPDIFPYFENPVLAKGEIRISGALSQMIESGKKVFGLQLQGKWLECGDKQSYLESDVYLSLKHPVFGEKLKKSIGK